MGSKLFELIDKTDEKIIWDKLGRKWAILCLDPTGFTRTVSKYGILYYLRLIKQMREIAAPIMHEYGAVKWKPKADNLSGCFVHPDRAINLFAL